MAGAFFVLASASHQGIMCMRRCMAMRTNIVIDEDTMRTAMEISGIRTKKGVVEQAIREFIAVRSKKSLKDLRGQIQFADGYDHTAHRKGM